METFSKTNGAVRITVLLASGSLYVALSLSTLLLIYDVAHGNLRARLWVAIGFVIYLCITTRFARRGRTLVANWMLVGMYELLAALMLFGWSINSPMGIITAAFAVLLPGVLMAPRLSLTVAIIMCLILVTTYSLHAAAIISPLPYVAPEKPNVLDTIAYITILGIFALVSWISAQQSLIGLTRALRAEEKLIKQKAQLAIELEKESSRLRQTQLQQIQQLYRFAVIGQSASATLHELSNHLSLLALDIDDIRRKQHHTQALRRTLDDVHRITHVIQKMRSTLIADQALKHPFKVHQVIRQIIKDVSPTYITCGIILQKKYFDGAVRAVLFGNEVHLEQILTVLLHNAAEACSATPHARVVLTTAVEATTLVITVSDNGPGVSKDSTATLFEPHESKKVYGLGVGLFIAKQLTESSFRGTIALAPSTEGASFILRLPLEAPLDV